MTFKNIIAYSKYLIKGTKIEVLKNSSTTLYVYDKVAGTKKDNITLPIAAKAIAYDGTNFWILISDGSFKKLDKNFAIAVSYSKSAAIPRITSTARA
ncbi:hypothetical protein [Clostridium ljungdahlii]|uniref:Uncharacterized protein n=1 Tax=Clostridium ljungdahlii TaxID=1538 RepID=A0A168M4V7_9CLOT|nr:hypothetical protein [Clostridium ljungdahlii]OAA84121.1 hypothetical protein WY13_02935 [Clostridium ljungdahlii]